MHDLFLRHHTIAYINLINVGLLYCISHGKLGVLYDSLYSFYRRSVFVSVTELATNKNQQQKTGYVFVVITADAFVITVWVKKQYNKWCSVEWCRTSNQNMILTALIVFELLGFMHIHRSSCSVIPGANRVKLELIVTPSWSPNFVQIEFSALKLYDVFASFAWKCLFTPLVIVHVCSVKTIFLSNSFTVFKVSKLQLFLNVTGCYTNQKHNRVKFITHTGCIAAGVHWVGPLWR